MPEFRITPDRERPAGWQLLQAFGVPIFIEPGFLIFVVFILFFWSGNPPDLRQGGLLCFIIFFSLLVHELGHALAAKFFKCDGVRIALRMFGGYATHSETTRGKSLIITLAGPAFGLVLGLVALACWLSPSVRAIGPPEAMDFILFYTVFINLFWTAFNMLPIHPLDGGQALYHALSFWISPTKAMLNVARVGLVLCPVVGFLGYRFGYIFIPLFCLFFFMDNLRTAQSLS